MGEFVRLEREGAVGVIRLERPPMNALSGKLVQELDEATREVTASGDIKAVVIWGGEKIFAAGADIKEFTSFTPAGVFDYGKTLQDAFSALAAIPKVTIAAINGFALGGGCELAMTADFRYAAEDAQLGQPEILLGIIPGAGGTQRLPRLVGRSRAKELIFTGRMIKSQEALEIGLVDRVYPAPEVFAKAVEAAQRFAAGPLVALKAAKLAIDRGLESDIDTGMAIERGAFATLFATKDAEQGVKSFIEKGPGKAEFKGE
ncbi:MAG TPA: enoyl-CoA hydratase/isomerase family protein [Actinomycetota bacterium]|nr:enoyl-CoA hydratase/isomerase family protein [Actinomycetota bacterium]